MKLSRLLAAFLAVILLLCLVPSVGLLLAGPSAPGANEIAPPAPKFITAQGKVNPQVLSDLSDYVGRRFFLRQELITLHHRIVSGVFATSAEDDVILGRDGWLFYGSTLADFAGTAPMRERAVFSAARNLALMREYCSGQGAQLLFVAAPNKNSLYPAYMPDCPIVSTEKNADRLHAALDAQQVPYLDLFSVLAAQPEPLYFAHDSHWNSRGAALGADSINAALGRSSSWFAADFSRQVRHDGDLYAMLYPAATDPEQDVVCTPAPDFSHLTENARPDSITLDTVSDADGTLLMFRDSFGNLLYPYLADSFGTARFSRQTAYDLTMIEALQADYVVIELVERNLVWLTQQRYCMPAPLRAPTAAQPTEACAALSVGTARAPEGCVRVDGVLPVEADTDSPVFLVCAGARYEAFLLQDGGFTACLPDTLHGNCLVQCMQNGVLIQCNTDLTL